MNKLVYAHKKRRGQNS